jgi:hypothetical protein
MIIEAWDTGAYRDVREIWERADILAGDDEFKSELIRGLNALTGHLEYDIGQIRIRSGCVLCSIYRTRQKGKIDSAWSRISCYQPN